MDCNLFSTGTFLGAPGDDLDDLFSFSDDEAGTECPQDLLTPLDFENLLHDLTRPEISDPIESFVHERPQGAQKPSRKRFRSWNIKEEVDTKNYGGKKFRYHRWRVRVGSERSSFSFQKHGGKELAYKKALDWRDAKLTAQHVEPKGK